MTVESDFRSFLIADGDINGLVGSRVYGTNINPQNGDMPSISFQRVDTTRTGLMNFGESGYKAADIQIDAWDENYDGVIALRDFIESRVRNYRGTMGSTAVDIIRINSGPVDVYENDVNRYRSSIGVEIWFNS